MKYIYILFIIIGCLGISQVISDAIDKPLKNWPTPRSEIINAHLNNISTVSVGDGWMTLWIMYNGYVCYCVYHDGKWETHHIRK